MRRTLVFSLIALIGSCSIASASAYTYTTIDVPGGSNTIAYGINDAGQIVGRFEGNGVHGFLYSGGGFSQVDVPGGTFTEAYGINNSNQIVGFYQVDGSGQFGFVDSGGSFSQITVGPTYTLARGINDSGAIVGYWNDILGQHGFLDNGGTITTFDATSPLPGGRFTRAYGINNAEQIAGTFFDGQVHGFIDSGGVFTQIAHHVESGV